jgi:hypothetical protein
MGLTRSSFVRTMVFQSTTKFLPGSKWFMDSLEFLTDKVTRSGTGLLPPAPVRVSLVNEAQLEHGLGSLGRRIWIQLSIQPITPWMPMQP